MGTFGEDISNHKEQDRTTSIYRMDSEEGRTSSGSGSDRADPSHLIGWRVSRLERLASYRYRVAIPIKEIRKMGIDAGIGVGSKVTVFSKHIPSDLAEASELKEKGIRVVFDVCDNHFASPLYGEHYRNMCLVADKVTCSSEHLMEAILKNTGRPATVIDDPYEFDEVLPAMPSGKIRNLLWYGHECHFPSLYNMGKLNGNLRIVTNKRPKKDLPQSYDLKMWSQDEMIRSLEWCDAVIIPVIFKGRGPNRMVEAIRRGRFVIANNMRSYAGYDMWLGDLNEGIDWASSHPEEALERVRNAQKIVRNRHDQGTIAKLWLKTLLG